MARRIGLIAGNRQFPLHVARAAAARGVEVVAIALHEETAPELAALVPTLHWIHLGQVGRLLALLRREQITEVLLAGQVHPAQATRRLPHLDADGLRVLTRAATRHGRDILAAFAAYLEQHGVTLLDSSTFLRDWIPAEAGVLTRRRPTPQESAAIECGRARAQAVASEGVGQTVVVKDGAVVAVEGTDGTDATIRRAGEAAGPGTVVVKLPEPRHDMRFDIPVVGPATVQAMSAAGATALAMAAGKTLLLERPAVIQQADAAGLALVALDGC